MLLTAEELSRRRRSCALLFALALCVAHALDAVASQESSANAGITGNPLGMSLSSADDLNEAFVEQRIDEKVARGAPEAEINYMDDIEHGAESEKGMEDCVPKPGEDVVVDLKWDKVKKQWVHCPGLNSLNAGPAPRYAAEDPNVQAKIAADQGPQVVHTVVHTVQGSPVNWPPGQAGEQPWPSRFQPPQGEALPPTVGVPPALPPNSEQQPNAEGTFPAHPPHAEHEAAVPPGGAAVPCQQVVTQNGTFVAPPLPKVRPVAELSKSQLENPAGPQTVGEAIQVIELINKIKVEAYLEAGLNPPSYLTRPGGSGRAAPPNAEPDESVSEQFALTQRIFIQIGFFSMLAGAATVGYGMHALKASREADAEEKLKAKQESNAA
mmetsp:Transcript_21691/g.49380  ORF Transcript_21691/g.49380 Transcript_21691/m.49380 type:complete len:381 (-) Transcript_21691:80-1222(-)